MASRAIDGSKRVTEVAGPAPDRSRQRMRSEIRRGGARVRDQRPTSFCLAAGLVFVAIGCPRSGPIDADAGETRDAMVDAGLRDGGEADADAGPSDAGGDHPDAQVDAGESDAGEVGDIGDPCDSAEDCVFDAATVDIPACIGPDASWVGGNQWTDGYCTAQCTPPFAPGEGTSLVASDCPASALCLPLSEELGACLLACESDDDCRFGYRCRRRLGSVAAPDLPVGVCAPWHCQSRGCSWSARCDC